MHSCLHMALSDVSDSCSPPRLSRAVARNCKVLYCCRILRVIFSQHAEILQYMQPKNNYRPILGYSVGRYPL